MARDPSPLELERLNHQPELPEVFNEMRSIDVQLISEKKTDPAIAPFFPHSPKEEILAFVKKGARPTRPLKVGVLFSGGPAAGGHNVLWGLFDGLHKLHGDSQLFGFLGGPSGLIEGKYRALKPEEVALYRNLGGFDLLGSGRTKIEKPEQFEKALKVSQDLGLQGLVIIGGDDSNTNAAHLAEFFESRGAKIAVVGIPKTIDGDLSGGPIEISFGFDTACKVYSEMIGNLARDAMSARKYTHFVKLMGRSASHVTLECALATHPNFTLIGEEIAEEKKSLKEIAAKMAEVILERSLSGKNYGVILIPEGIIEFVPEMKRLIAELNSFLTSGKEKVALEGLSSEARRTYESLPEKIQRQLLLERDPHGNVQVSQVASEELFIEMVRRELADRSAISGKFAPIAHFLGYEGRSGFPTNFDASYTYALGHAAAALIHLGKSSYLAAVSNLSKPISEWQPGAISTTQLMQIEERKGKKVPVVAKRLVDLHGAPFIHFCNQRKGWQLEDDYRFPGPIQFHGSRDLVDQPPLSLKVK